MFRAVINRTPLTEDVANDFFQNIVADDFGGDVTLCSTLRALVAPRMKDGENLVASVSSSHNSTSELSNYSKRDILRSFVDVDYISPNSIRIHNFTGTVDSVQMSLDIVKSTFCSTYRGWHQLENVTVFFRKQLTVLCYINPDVKSAVLFIENMDIRKYHYLQCSILAFLPWYFDPEKGVSETEMSLIKSLKEKSPEMYMDCIAKIAEQYDFKTARIRKLLAGFETRFERQSCDKVRKDITSVDRDIDEYYNQIANLMRSRRDLEIKLLGLETKIARGSEDSEIMEYFLSNSKIRLEDVTDTRMVFVAREYLEYFDEDMVKAAIRNDDSYVYIPRGKLCNKIIPHDDMKMFMEAVFLKQKLRIRVCAAYQFDLGVQVQGLAHYGYGSEFRDCTPNPHIDGYRCMGNYRQAISNLIKDNNYIMALEQCIASCKSLNFGDSTVMSEFMSRLYGISDYNVNMRCVELPDGSVVTPKEAIDYLKAEGQENEQAD